MLKYGKSIVRIALSTLLVMLVLTTFEVAAEENGKKEVVTDLQKDLIVQMSIKPIKYLSKDIEYFYFSTILGRQLDGNIWIAPPFLKLLRDFKDIDIISIDDPIDIFLVAGKENELDVVVLFTASRHQDLSIHPLLGIILEKVNDTTLALPGLIPGDRKLNYLRALGDGKYLYASNFNSLDKYQDDLKSFSSQKELGDSLLYIYGNLQNRLFLDKEFKPSLYETFKFITSNIGHHENKVEIEKYVLETLYSKAINNLESLAANINIDNISIERRSISVECNIVPVASSELAKYFTVVEPIDLAKINFLPTDTRAFIVSSGYTGLDKTIYDIAQKINDNLLKSESPEDTLITEKFDGLIQEIINANLFPRQIVASYSIDSAEKIRCVNYMSMPEDEKLINTFLEYNLAYKDYVNFISRISEDSYATTLIIEKDRKDIDGIVYNMCKVNSSIFYTFVKDNMFVEYVNILGNYPEYDKKYIEKIVEDLDSKKYNNIAENKFLAEKINENSAKTFALFAFDTSTLRSKNNNVEAFKNIESSNYIYGTASYKDNKVKAKIDITTNSINRIISSGLLYGGYRVSNESEDGE